VICDRKASLHVRFKCIQSQLVFCCREEKYITNSDFFLTQQKYKKCVLVWKFPADILKNSRFFFFK